MKIWLSHSGEHSSNLRIVGNFNKEEDAAKAAALFNKLLNLRESTDLSWRDMWGDNELARTLSQEQCYDMLGDDDYDKLEYFSPIKPKGNIIQAKLDTYDMQPLVKTLLFYGASVKLYDLDVYPEKE